MNLYAVIMAGGIGARFWPRSKKKSPKQLLKIIGERTMIQETFARLNGLVPRENILIVTNETQKPGIMEQLPEIPVENIIVEPAVTNLQGIYVADKVISTGTAPELEAEGMFIGWEGFNFGRTMASLIKPAEKFTYRPDLVLNAPPEFRKPSYLWNEVNPF